MSPTMRAWETNGQGIGRLSGTTLTPYPLEQADIALQSLSEDRVHGAAVLRIRDL